jgi:ABC-type bacteriocin/lantibiotic exporter with double-glycine peptidase domain
VENRIEVELDARLFGHLMALPIAYFRTRRVGDSVARARELENIRQFLTRSALTLVIDLVFTVVFLVVMFYYSTPLTLIVLASFLFYIGISAGAEPLFRRRLDEKFNRDFENQAFLVKHHGCRDANLPPMPGVFRDYPAPVIRNAGDEREMVSIRWGMPPLRVELPS